MADEKFKRFEMLAPPSWIEAVDRWRARQLGLPSRAEAIRRLVEEALSRYQDNTPVSDTPPFVDGDRIHHAKFGDGTVVGSPVATVRGDQYTGEIVPAGWRVTVHWDDEARGISDIADRALRKVE